MKHERAGIGHQRGVETSRHLGRKLHAGFAAQAENHLSGSYSLRIDPVDVGERTAADVVIDTDQKTIFESFEAGAMNAVALQNNGRFVTADDTAGFDNLIGKRQ